MRELEEAAGREHDELRERAEEAEKYAQIAVHMASRRGGLMTAGAFSHRYAEECHAEKARQAQALTQVRKASAHRPPPARAPTCCSLTPPHTHTLTPYPNPPPPHPAPPTAGAA